MDMGEREKSVYFGLIAVLRSTRKEVYKFCVSAYGVVRRVWALRSTLSTAVVSFSSLNLVGMGLCPILTHNNCTISWFYDRNVVFLSAVDLLDISPARVRGVPWSPSKMRLRSEKVLDSLYWVFGRESCCSRSLFHILSVYWLLGRASADGIRISGGSVFSSERPWFMLLIESERAEQSLLSLRLPWNCSNRFR